MDTNQRALLLRAIAVSSSSSPIIIASTTPKNRADALSTLEQFKAYDGRIPIALDLLQTDRHLFTSEHGEVIDVTAAVKLYSLGILETCLRSSYSQASDAERFTFRNAIITATRQIVNVAGNNIAVTTDGEIRILGMKLAALLADLALREFPQRWNSFIKDLFVPVDHGGIWYDDSTQNSSSAKADSYGSMIGVKIGLECLKLITEDCTDSDFNAKVSTVRRNDVLIGLNEVRNDFLPLIYSLLSSQFSKLSQAKNSLHEMEQYLLNSGRKKSQMSSDERALYECQLTKRDIAGRLTADCLVTIERFAQYMPIEWITSTSEGYDYISAFFHLLREDIWQIQILAATCLEQLALRKLNFDQWIRIISALPKAVLEANSISSQSDSFNAAVDGFIPDELTKLVAKLPFHRILARMFSSLIAAHLAFISTNKDFVKDGGPLLQVLSPFLDLMTDLLSHPSGHIASEQINMWIALLREPVITQSQTRFLRSFLERVLNAYMVHIVRIRWEDVELRRHPLTALLEESWCDKEEYDGFLCELRSRSSQLFKLVGSAEPELASVVIGERIKCLLQTYGDGIMRDHTDANTGQLTQFSEAVVQLEAVSQPLDSVLQGLPLWSLDGVNTSDNTYVERSRSETRNIVRSALSEVAHAIVKWNPIDVWLKFRKATMLEALKFYWEYDPATLGDGVDSLLSYLNVNDSSTTTQVLSDDVISLRKKSGSCLISVSKCIPQLLVSHLGPLCERAKLLLSSNALLPANEMHLYEFLTCVATAIDDPLSRSHFIANVLANALNVIQSREVTNALDSPESFLSFLGIVDVGNDHSKAIDPTFVHQVSSRFVNMYSSFNQLLSVGKRCHEAARKRPNGGIPVPDEFLVPDIPLGLTNFPDEGPVSVRDLMQNDPFVPLWTDIFPSLIRCLDVILSVWHRETQLILLQNSLQRYALAMSDDELYLAKKQEKGDGGVFGKGGTAGSIVSGCDRRSKNLIPKWSGWFNELRNTCFQLLGLASSQRVLFSPEIGSLYPKLVSVIVDLRNLQAMEHRHITQFLKQFIEVLLLSCPSTMYRTHLSPILGPLFHHFQHRLCLSWEPILKPGPTSESTSPLTTATYGNVIMSMQRDDAHWLCSYYARGGLFIGDADLLTGEAVSEKVRVELTRCFSDMIQAALALKGEWALVLANQAKEEQAGKTGDKAKINIGPSSQVRADDGPVNADGTPRSIFHPALEARKNLRIHNLCNYLLLDDFFVAENLVVTVIDCLQYPDAYTCRRCTKICHRILETVAWSDRYVTLLGNRLFSIVVKAIVTEPKWMVGIEWDMINLLRDIYCRLVLGQTLLFGGQGVGMDHFFDTVQGCFEQAKTVNTPLQGGGILCKPTDYPRRVLLSLPGMTADIVIAMEKSLAQKRAAKDQKDVLRDLLRISADCVKISETSNDTLGIFSRAAEAESLLSQNIRRPTVPDLSEKLVTYTMVKKQKERDEEVDMPSLDNLLDP